MLNLSKSNQNFIFLSVVFPETLAQQMQSLLKIIEPPTLEIKSILLQFWLRKTIIKITPS